MSGRKQRFRALCATASPGADAYKRDALRTNNINSIANAMSAESASALNS